MRAEGVLKEGPLAGKAVQMGSGQTMVAVTPHMIGAERVNTQQDNVRRVLSTATLGHGSS